MKNLRRILFDGFLFGYTLGFFLIIFIHPTHHDDLQLGINALISLGLFIVGASAAEILHRLHIDTLGKILFQPSTKLKEEAPTKWYRTFWGWQLIVGLVVTFYLGKVETRFQISELIDPDGLAGALRLFKGVATPNLAILPEAVMAIIQTIYIAFMATALAIPIAFVLSFFSAKNLMSANAFTFSIYMFLRTSMNIIRSVEALIWAIIASVWVGIGPFAGMMALWIHSIASLTKQYSEFVESVNDGPMEGISSTGANVVQTVWFAIVPQITLPYISFTIYRWDINVRMATIIGLVGGGGIGTMLIQYQGQAMWKEVGCLLMVIAAVVWLMDTFSAYVREALK